MAKQSRLRAFTLVELLVACTILVILLVALGSLSTGSTNLLRSTSEKAEQFREARAALDSIQQTLSQATLNTYWDYKRTTASAPPSAYIRQSELRFISGPAGTLELSSALVANSAFSTHAAFFQAPLGVVSDAASYGNMRGLMNTCGYYVAFASDAALRPTFLTSAVPARYRYRLMEVRQPADKLSLYNYTSGVDGTGQPKTGSYTGKEWFKEAVSAPALQAAPQILAENVIALVILPQLSQADQTKLTQTSGKTYNANSLAPTYLYDSTGAGMAATVTDKNLNPTNQLPPVVQITLVAIDEASAARITNAAGNDPQLTAGLFTDPGNYAADLQTLQDTLNARRIKYRVLNTKFNLLASKWSASQ